MKVISVRVTTRRLLWVGKINDVIGRHTNPPLVVELMVVCTQCKAIPWIYPKLRVRGPTYDVRRFQTLLKGHATHTALPPVSIQNRSSKDPLAITSRQNVHVFV